MTKFKTLTILVAISCLFILSACTDINLSQSVYSDGSVVVKQEIDLLEYMQSLMAEGEMPELTEEDINLTPEEQLLLNTKTMAESMCNDNLENAERDIDDVRWQEIFSACEALDNGKVVFYSVFAPGTFTVEKKGDFYDYYLHDFVFDHELIGDNDEADFLFDMQFTLFFEDEIISSDVGTIDNNQLTFSSSEVKQAIQEDNNAMIRARVNTQLDSLNKFIIYYSIKSKDEISLTTGKHSLLPYSSRIEQMWGLNKEQLRHKLCVSDDLKYSSLVQEIDCSSDQDTIIQNIGRGISGRGLFLETDDYYQYKLMDIVALDKVDNSSLIADILYFQFPARAEFNFKFFSHIQEASLGTIKNNNELVLSWEDINKIDGQSIVKINKTGASGSQTETLNIRSIKHQVMYANLKGKILLQVEANGEAYYIHPSKQEMYFLGRPDDAFSVMREQGIGISNANLAKIPVALSNLSGPDSDGDGLPDALEVALGTNPHNSDSDGDGYDDFTELLHGYNPLGPGRLTYDLNFSKAQAGKIFLQVERNGEAWYVNPADNKRYFLGRPADAFNVMRNLGLGISNSNLDKLSN